MVLPRNIVVSSPFRLVRRSLRQQQRQQHVLSLSTSTLTIPNNNNKNTTHSYNTYNNNNNNNARTFYTRTIIRLNSSSSDNNDIKSNVDDESKEQQDSQELNNDNDNSDDDDNEGWIQPNRPLIGDVGHSYMYQSNVNFLDDASAATEEELFQKELDFEQFLEEKELRKIELELQNIEEEEKILRLQQQQQQVEDNRTPDAPDWLQLRRTIFGDAPTNESGLSASQNNTGTTTTSDDNDIIACKPYTLLSKNEIIKCLSSLGGDDIVLILDDLNLRRMGGPLGIILVTANNPIQMRRMGEMIVRQLRKRQLHKLNVIGAELGIEGDSDQQQWIVIDCCNYVVHIQDSLTRKAIDLQALWSGKDPLFRIKSSDDEAVENYVAAYPVPDTYIVDGSGYGSNKSIVSSSSKSSFSDTIQRLQKTRFTVNRQEPLINKPNKKSGGFSRKTSKKSGTKPRK